MKKTAIVTGASSGIGQAIAEKLIQEDVNVVLAARRFDRLESLAKEMNQLGKGEAFPGQTDIALAVDVEHLFTQAVERFGAVDYYVNNAGQMLSGAVTDGALDEWEQMVDVNVKGLLYSLH